MRNDCPSSFDAPISYFSSVGARLTAPNFWLFILRTNSQEFNNSLLRTGGGTADEDIVEDSTTEVVMMDMSLFRSDRPT